MSSKTKQKPKAKSKPKIAVFKFASCDGCQLSLIDAEDELLGIVGAVDIAYFPEVSRAMLKGPYDIGLVEGSVTTHGDAQRIQEVRRQWKCEQAIRNYDPCISCATHFLKLTVERGEAEQP
jgi:coenzyme F420-reducing hydrogenase gamma subunit